MICWCSQGLLMHILPARDFQNWNTGEILKVELSIKLLHFRSIFFEKEYLEPTAKFFQPAWVVNYPEVSDKCFLIFFVNTLCLGWLQLYPNLRIQARPQPASWSQGASRYLLNGHKSFLLPDTYFCCRDCDLPGVQHRCGRSVLPRAEQEKQGALR